MALPNKTQISNAVEDSSSFVASQLKGYKAETGILGPDHYSGGFCIVFPIDNGKKRKALRVWHTEISNIKERYKLISDDIAHAELPFLSNVEYIEKGLQVGTEYVDIVLMDWIDGLPLKKYIEQILLSADSEPDKQQQLKQLANNLLHVFKSMHNAHFAHGDLQHDNIIIKTDGSIALIDYDNFYTQSLHSNFLQTTTGYDGYQHPDKKTALYSSIKDDYFAELVIYLSILSFAEDSSLWEISKDDDFALLLTNSDYVNLQHSVVFQRIRQLGGELSLLCNILEEYLKHKDVDELLPFDMLLMQNKVSFTASATKVVRNSQSVELAWNVPFDADIVLRKGSETIVKECKKQGTVVATLSGDTSFELSIKTFDKQVIKKEITILVFDECTIEFKADKYYIFPSIPVVLSWKVTNAKSIQLDSETIEGEGTKIVEPEKATVYVLRAEDEFGIKEKRISIEMLPIPQVKSILVPTPNIVSNMSISIQQPRYNVDVKFPQIDIEWITAEVPKVKSLTELGLNVELSPPLSKVNLMSSIKRVFNHIIKR